MRTASLPVLQIKFRDHTATKIVVGRGSMFKTNVNLNNVSFTASLFALKPVWAQCQGCGSGYFSTAYASTPIAFTNKNEKTTVDLSTTKFVIYYNQKVYPKIQKWQKPLKEGKIKANNQKDSKDKIISTLRRFVCPRKHNDIN